jgi:hypothetical protein
MRWPSVAPSSSPVVIAVGPSGKLVEWLTNLRGPRSLRIGGGVASRLRGSRAFRPFIHAKCKAAPGKYSGRRLSLIRRGWPCDFPARWGRDLRDKAWVGMEAHEDEHPDQQADGEPRA